MEIKVFNPTGKSIDEVIKEHMEINNSEGSIAVRISDGYAGFVPLDFTILVEVSEEYDRGEMDLDLIVPYLCNIENKVENLNIATGDYTIADELKSRGFNVITNKDSADIHMFNAATSFHYVIVFGKIINPYHASMIRTKIKLSGGSIRITKVN